MRSLLALFIGLSLVYLIASDQEHGTDGMAKRSRQASEVLERPVLQGVAVVDDDLILQMRWESHWSGGELDIPGTLFLDHRDEPAGRAIALSVDASALAKDANYSIRVPLDGEDESNQVLRQADFADLSVMFSTGY